MCMPRAVIASVGDIEAGAFDSSESRISRWRWSHFIVRA
jgi:hypothetical protein